MKSYSKSLFHEAFSMMVFYLFLPLPLIVEVRAGVLSFDAPRLHGYLFAVRRFWPSWGVGVLVIKNANPDAKYITGV